MTLQFRKAVKYDAKLRLAISAPTGAGKTWTSLLIATRLAEATGSKIAVIDTEHGSASKYADRFDFDALDLRSYGPLEYVAAIEAAQQAGYGILIIDSLSHAWMGKNGALEQVDRAGDKGGNSYTAWREVTPQQNRLVDTMIGCDMHLIATMRAKMDYVLEDDSRGKKVPRKVGMAPVQRDGIEFEFDIVGEMNQAFDLTITKSRCPALAGIMLQRPTGIDVADTLLAWLKGEAPPVLPKPTTPPPAARPPQQRQPAQTAPAAKPGAKPTARGGNCPEHGKAWAATPSGKQGHPIPGGWCLQENQGQTPSLKIVTAEDLARLDTELDRLGLARDTDIIESYIRETFAPKLDRNQLHTGELTMLIAWLCQEYPADVESETQTLPGVTIHADH